MELIQRGINLIFLDNSTVSTDYIKNLTTIANIQSLVTKTTLNSTIKLLLVVELDRVEQERELIVKRIKQGKLDKMSDKLRDDIKEFLSDRSIKQIDLMNKHNISRNTLKKYITIVQGKHQ